MCSMVYALNSSVMLDDRQEGCVSEALAAFCRFYTSRMEITGWKLNLAWGNMLERSFLKTEKV